MGIEIILFIFFALAMFRSVVWEAKFYKAVKLLRYMANGSSATTWTSNTATVQFEAKGGQGNV